MAEVHKALIAARREFQPVLKDKKADAGRKGSYRYATLEGLLEAVGPALDRHGLMLLQPLDVNGLRSEVVHPESGTSIVGIMPMPTIGGDPQAWGSTLSYARRYAALALLGIVAEDDDGQRARQPQQKPPAKPANGYDPETGEVMEPPLRLMLANGKPWGDPRPFAEAASSLEMWARNARIEPVHIRNMVRINARELDRIKGLQEALLAIADERDGTMNAA